MCLVTRHAAGNRLGFESFCLKATWDEEVVMFLTLFLVLFVCWIFGFVVFHVAGGLIHALLIVAAISLVWHFVSARATV